jgi:hypothetical protein
MKDGKYFVKPWKLMEKEYGADESNLYITCGKRGWTRGMEGICPSNRIITVNNDQWAGFNISPEMLVGPAFEWGEEAEFSDGGINWFKHKFLGIAPGVDRPYVTNNFRWKQARLIQELIIEINVKINGKEAKLSDISDETFRKLKEAES